jgi:preprotein translocase subunit SecF
MAFHFRELIRPGTTIEFMGRRKLFLMISLFLTVASIGMLFVNHAMRGSMLNWTIDFKGGTEIVSTFDKPVSAADVRGALTATNHEGVDVSTFKFTDEAGKTQDAYLIRLPKFGAIDDAKADKIEEAFTTKYGNAILKASWSGDTFHIRSTRALTQEEITSFLKEQGIEAKPWTAEQAKEFATPAVGTNEYNYSVPVFGLARAVETQLESALGTQATIRQVDGVGAKAGADLRNDAIKSLLYAIVLILLYVAFRFDFRYGPGTVVALLHDAIVVVGIFAVTWTEFSLTTVAAVLTVIGYSMNDTIVVFDRIRENEHRLKDKRFDRVINISLNETLSRTILTSLTTMATTLAMNLLGTGLVKNFAFAMNIGIVVGTYSSICVAAPILLWLNDRFWSRRTATARRPTHSVEPA